MTKFPDAIAETALEAAERKRGDHKVCHPLSPDCLICRTYFDDLDDAFDRYNERVSKQRSDALDELKAVFTIPTAKLLTVIIRAVTALIPKAKP
jgi:hypothetical protein